MHRRRLVGHRSWHHRLLFSSGCRKQLRLKELQRGRRGLPNTYNKTNIPRGNRCEKKKVVARVACKNTSARVHMVCICTHAEKDWVSRPLPRCSILKRKTGSRSRMPFRHDQAESAPAGVRAPYCTAKCNSYTGRTVLLTYPAIQWCTDCAILELERTYSTGVRVLVPLIKQTREIFASFPSHLLTSA